MKISDIGEFGLIQSLKELVCQWEQPTQDAIFPMVLGIGDDGAVWQTTTAMEIATTDTLVDGVHFRQDLISWEDLGWKAVVVNLSDIAAMGGLPLYSLVTLGLKPETEVEEIKSLYMGMLSACHEYKCRIVGGDMVQSPVTFITISMTGVAQVGLLSRKEAIPGDVIAVTGPLGCASGGLQVLLNDTLTDGQSGVHLSQTHRRPIPRLTECQMLVQNGVRNAMDISDGLVDDLSKMCVSSGVGAIIHSYQVPVDSFLKNAFPESYLEFALNGGEDYEILFTGEENIVLDVVNRLSPHAAVIGRIVADDSFEVHVLDELGKDLSINRQGWDHFK